MSVYRLRRTTPDRRPTKDRTSQLLWNAVSRNYGLPSEVTLRRRSGIASDADPHYAALRHLQLPPSAWTGLCAKSGFWRSDCCCLVSSSRRRSLRMIGIPARNRCVSPTSHVSGRVVLAAPNSQLTRVGLPGLWRPRHLLKSMRSWSCQRGRVRCVAVLSSPNSTLRAPAQSLLLAYRLI